MKISISTKLIVLTVIILLATTVPIAIKSSQYFQKVSSDREDYNNLDSAISKAKEVDNIISYWVGKAQTYSSELYKVETSNNLTLKTELAEKLKKEKFIFNIQVYKVSGEKYTSLYSLANTEVVTPLLPQISPTAYFNQVRAEQKFPFVNVGQTGNIEIKHSGKINKLPLITIGLPIVKDTNQLISHIALVDISLSPIQKPFLEQSERTQFLVDKQGTILAHSIESIAIAGMDFSKNNEFVKSLPNKDTPQIQVKYIDINDTKYYKMTPSKIFYEEHFGAAAKTSYGVTVVSKIPVSIILEPAIQVRRQAFFITGIAISISLFIIFLISMSLTSPIETLAELIKIVSTGNFDVRAREKVKSRDEVGALAIAFDQMTEGLKERDKVKNLFNKFHGSSVAEDLLKNEVTVGGQNKEVVVFFSDIRGFTAFSESRPPEEVVEMLNEYFTVMVKIINQYNGVVDKFIGDAIMAVWGAPKSSDKDAFNAVRACLEMRKSLEILNEKRLAKNQPPIQIGMGLHAGRAISGTIGSDERMEYTVIGNTVNTASRIEASTKAFGADLLITEEVLEKAGSTILAEIAGSAEVKGRSEAIKMYKVLGYQENGSDVIIKTKWSEYTAEKADKVKIAS